MFCDNYPAGSMRGSGIYSGSVVRYVECRYCDYEGKEDVTFSDFGIGGFDCPQCGEENEFDMDDFD